MWFLLDGLAGVGCFLDCLRKMNKKGLAFIEHTCLVVSGCWGGWGSALFFKFFMSNSRGEIGASPFGAHHVVSWRNKKHISLSSFSWVGFL